MNSTPTIPAVNNNSITGTVKTAMKPVPQPIAFMRWLFVAFGALGSAFSYFFFFANLCKGAGYFGQSMEQLFPIVSRLLSWAPKTAGYFDQGRGLISTLFQFFYRNLSIDLSAITPFILSFYFTLMLKQSMFPAAMHREPFKSENFECLPLLYRYKHRFVQLGFIGTLWGFILIGLKMVNLSAGQGNTDTIQIKNLLDIIIFGFATATVSTFSAVFIVYVVNPLVARLWRWSFRIAPEQYQDEFLRFLASIDAATGAIQTNIVTGLKAMGTALDTSTKSVDALAKSVALCTNNFKLWEEKDWFKKQVDAMVINTTSTENHLSTIDTHVSSIMAEQVLAHATLSEVKQNVAMLESNSVKAIKDAESSLNATISTNMAKTQSQIITLSTLGIKTLRRSNSRIGKGFRLFAGLAGAARQFLSKLDALGKSIGRSEKETITTIERNFANEKKMLQEQLARMQGEIDSIRKDIRDLET